MEIGPAQPPRPQQRPVIGQPEQIVGNTHLLPLVDVFLLALAGQPIVNAQKLQHLCAPGLPPPLAGQIIARRFIVVQSQVVPAVGLLFHLPGGEPPPLGAVAYQQGQHLGGQAQRLIDIQQGLQLPAVEHPPHLALKIIAQAGKGRVLLPGLGQLGGGIGRPLPGRRRGVVHRQAVDQQQLRGLFHLFGRKIQRLGGLGGRAAPVPAGGIGVKQGGIAVPQAGQRGHGLPPGPADAQLGPFHPPPPLAKGSFAYRL